MSTLMTALNSLHSMVEDDGDPVGDEESDKEGDRGIGWLVQMR